MKERKLIQLHTLFVSIEQDALSFEDEDDVFWVGAIQDSCRLCTKELVGFVDFLKHVLKRVKLKLNQQIKLCKPLNTYHVSNGRNTYPALWVLVRMVLLCKSEVSFPDFTLLVPEDKNYNIL